MEHPFVNPVTTRSRVVLEIASELVAANETLRQAKVMLRAQGSPGWSLCLYGSSTAEGIDEVVARRANTRRRSRSARSPASPRSTSMSSR